MTNYPGTLDSFTNPAPTDYEDVVSHSGQHSNINDAMEAVQGVLGTTAGSAALSSLSGAQKALNYLGTPALGDLNYYNGTSWISLATGTANAGKYLTTDGTLPSWATAGAAFWTNFTGSYGAAGTIYTVGTYANILRRGSIIKWTDSAGTAYKHGMVNSISGTVISILGTVSSGDKTFQYCILDAQSEVFIIPGNLGTSTDISKKSWATDTFYPLSANIHVGSAGNGTSVIDVNFNGTTMFTAKPTLTGTASYSTDFVADNLTTSYAKDGYINIDCDTASGTVPVDTYLTFYYMPASWRYR